VGLPQRSVEHLLGRGLLQSPSKIGGRWFASRAKLLREFGLE
jgi:hypothetical protein